ncbi:zonadhesin-like, partial [Polyodon spathula]|uniref:zonadhesin-like n=1 Tax=Polyodon spathula TaxID=7913 RepID=UPI001B7E4300
MDCNFDRGFCEWTQSTTDRFDWTRMQGSTPSPYTGPSYDHTSGGGHYVYIEGNLADTGDLAQLVSPECTATGPHCFRFWYHMYGVARTMALNVYLVENSTPVLMWTATGNKGDRWYSAEVELNISGRFKIILEGVRGNDYRSDVAVDDVSIEFRSCSGTTTAKPPPTPSPSTTTTTATTVTTIGSTTSVETESACVVSGDPHYQTFDKQMHHFMGNCTYTLSKRCSAHSSLPFFNVEAANEYRRGNTRVSYVSYVNVEVDSYRITLQKNRVVKVNGQMENVPVTVTSGLHVGLSGRYVMVSTGFGLRVKFDGDHRVEVTLPSSFREKVCGMCGNYNGDQADDFLNPDGEMEPDSTSLGNSWQVHNESNCSSGPVVLPECSVEEKEIIESKNYCGLIIDDHGPFKKCHSKVAPRDYFVNCVYDLCELNMDVDALCKSLQSYADMCQAQGVDIPPWRNSTFCSIPCGPNSHYEPCSTACPASCVNPNAPSTCNLPCVEGCACDSGYLLHNDRCVSSMQCGCWLDGKHYPVGSEFWTDDTCSTKCTCPSRGGKLTCSATSCPKDYYCGISNGVPGCYPHTYGICRVHNDPHYNTFDKATHHFMGTCTYTLAKLCTNSSSLPYFNVEAKNENRGHPSISYVQQVHIDVYNHRISIVRGNISRVLVGGVWRTLPVTLLAGAITVGRSGRYVVLGTDFKLTVSYDTDHTVEVKVPSSYFNGTCGMCGNYNSLRGDEYMKPDGSQGKDSNELGNSWQVEDGDSSCMPNPPPDFCLPEAEELYGSDSFCGLITKKDGPFANCLSVVNPESFFESCVFDMCALSGAHHLLCDALQAYADACQSAGVNIPPWRNTTFCQIPCPANSHYNVCSSACPATCTDQGAPENCSRPCVEGCECNRGFVLSGGKCVSLDACGCWHNGQYYEKDEVLMEENCERRCQCLGNAWVCTPMSCGPQEICKVQNGHLGCYPESTATCHIYGDPHYKTFDGKLYHFQGACNYTVTETCGNTSVSFTVTTRNEHRGNPTWTAINSVALQLEDVHIAVRKNNLVYVDEVLKTTLPWSPRPGISVSQSGSYVVIDTHFGLQLKFNGDHELLVHVRERYQGKLCGLCGTYSNSQKDDFMRPDKVVVQDFNEFGHSWRVSDDKWPCASDPPPPPPLCPPVLEQEAEQHCGILLAKDG